ncbi:unnamed protein product, partial [Mesorhabditis belari]|uniref:Uncharacterized protein n=1 Tax=Mesorhabditis belari TaxID=2138241 RepID=A0AAF3FHN6_9BILA
MRNRVFYSDRIKRGNRPHLFVASLQTCRIMKISCENDENSLPYLHHYFDTQKFLPKIKNVEHFAIRPASLMATKEFLGIRFPVVNAGFSFPSLDSESTMEEKSIVREFVEREEFKGSKEFYLERLAENFELLTETNGKFYAFKQKNLEDFQDSLNFLLRNGLPGQNSASSTTLLLYANFRTIDLGLGMAEDRNYDLLQTFIRFFDYDLTQIKHIDVNSGACRPIKEIESRKISLRKAPKHVHQLAAFENLEEEIGERNYELVKILTRKFHGIDPWRAYFKQNISTQRALLMLLRVSSYPEMLSKQSQIQLITRYHDH